MDFVEALGQQIKLEFSQLCCKWYENVPGSVICRKERMCEEEAGKFYLAL
jgi:hypothetical protein